MEKREQNTATKRWDISEASRTNLYQSLSISAQSEDIAAVTLRALEHQGMQLREADQLVNSAEDVSLLSSAAIEELRQKERKRRQQLWCIVISFFLIDCIVLCRLLTNYGSLF